MDKYQYDRSSSICPLGDLNNNKSETSISISPIYICPLGVLNKYTSDTSISMCPTEDKYKYKFVIGISKSLVPHTRDVNKHKFVIRISMYAKLLYDNKYMY